MRVASTRRRAMNALKTSVVWTTLALALALASFGSSGTARGHHSFSAEFTRDLPVDVRGTVAR
jgi:hypothetical protein